MGIQLEEVNEGELSTARFLHVPSLALLRLSSPLCSPPPPHGSFAQNQLPSRRRPPTPPRPPAKTARSRFSFGRVRTSTPSWRWRSRRYGPTRVPNLDVGDSGRHYGCLDEGVEYSCFVATVTCVLVVMTWPR